ncbi:beta-ketoacyl-ACP synthase III [Lachnospiraceae bacterium WCA-9-b2]|uniref:Beta-ketoacyl-[acyl-carrier-protein] synthase III n=2 Tax=Sporofaciens musculi TaxID=2681861 RepID=A0A7X3SKR4_9FIRM|nr:beta-ketoacyl-ACP synthase III [Sporofaciens musculi]MCI9423134.1 ketoacyl-ACP synthase III [Dorea sp.]MXP77799.1 beta-ketoacyl-ACP synthase III [Sporofaciens musculi]
MTATICGTGSYIPSYTMDNHEIAGMVDTSDEWIQERTGIVRRHIIQNETTVSMAAEAGRRALENGGVSAEEVDLILVSTISSNLILPCAACEVQKELGAVNATCFDLSAACTGFVLAYNTAMAYLLGGMYRTALVIGSESLSNLTNWKDRGTCILFGDGAGAAVIRLDASDKSVLESDGRSYLPVTHSDGGRGEALTCKSRHDFNGLTGEKHRHCPEDMMDASYYMQMDGQAVFKFAVKSVPEVIGEVLKLNRVDTRDISYYIMHQANQRIVEAVAKRLGEPMEKFPMNLKEYGNTSSASIPILLDEMNRKGRLKKGQKIVLAGFGAGLTWGASIVEWRR